MIDISKVTIIYTLAEGEPDIRKRAEYTLPPKKALVCFIEQFINKNFNTWEYPEEIKGMRESETVKDHWYFDVFPKRLGDKNMVVAAYPAQYCELL
jgi:hypothetical protein